MAAGTTTAQTEEQKDRTAKCFKLDEALSKLHRMTAGQLAAYAENEFGHTLTMDNGRTWLHLKVGYMEQERIYGGLTGRAAERAALLDTPARIAELKADDSRTEELSTKTPNRRNTAMNDAQEPRTATPRKTEKATGKKTEKAASKKTEKAASKKTEGRKGRAGRYADGDKITLLTKENPKREGTHAHTKFALYSKHKTVGEYLKAGGTSSSLIWDTQRGYIKIESSGK